MRDTYYQSTDNPIQHARLPSTRPTLDLPLYTLSFGEQLNLTILLVLAFSSLGAGIVLFGMCGGENLVMAVVLLTYFGYYLGRAIRKSAPTMVVVPLGIVLAAFAYLQFRSYVTAQVLCALCVVALFGRRFAFHYADRATVAPLKREAAQTLRRLWTKRINLYALVLVVLPLGTFILALAASHDPTTMLVACGCLLVGITFLVYSLRSPLRAVIGFVEALLAWFCYDRFDRRLPGVFVSPAGTWKQRMFLSAAMITLTALPVGMLCSLNAVAYVSREEAVFRQALAAQIDGETGEGPPANQILSTVLYLALSVGVSYFVLPTLLCFGAVFFVSSPILAAAYSTNHVRRLPNWWYDLIDGIQCSADKTERQSVYMGVVAADGSPILVLRKVFGEHAHFLGPTGTGKTSLGLCPVVEQLMLDGSCTVIFIDMKADTQECYASLGAATERARAKHNLAIPLRHFTNEIGQPTYAFNPLRQSYLSELSVSQKTDILCTALGVAYGTEYGQGFYSAANKNAVNRAFEHNENPNNFRELHHAVERLLTAGKDGELLPDEQRAGIHVKMVLKGLAAIEALNVAPGGKHSQLVLEHAIDLAAAFSEPRAYYFRLSSARGRSSAAEIGRLVVYSLLTAATCVQRKTQVYLVIDEFQEMLAGNLAYVFRCARSMGIGMILANQSMDDLKTSTMDLIPILETNCRLRQWFGVTSENEFRRLCNLSGQGVDESVSRTTRNNSESITRQEVVVPRLGTNDLKLASDDDLQSIFMLNRGSGYAQYGGFPFIAKTDYHVSHDEYERRQHTPLQAGPGTFAATRKPDDEPLDDESAAKQPSPPGGPTISTETVSPEACASDSGSTVDPFESYFSERGK